MQLKVKVYLDTPITLPISYHHTFQSIIYNLMGDEYEKTTLHDEGATFGKRKKQ